MRTDWVIADHYALDARWHRMVAGELHCRVGAIDDLADRPLQVQLLVDHNADPDHGAKYKKVLRPSAPMLGGPRFALLSKRYRRARPYEFKAQVGSIGIFMGGTDPAGATCEALRACREVARFGGDIEVVSASQARHHNELLELARRWPRTHVLSDLPDLSEFFGRHDLQVGAAGGASWERCCLGAPAVVCSIAANQEQVLANLARLGAVRAVAGEAPASQSLGRAVAELLADPGARQAMSRVARGLVDGLGSARVAGVLTASAGVRLQLRSAQAEDEQLLLEWANDDQARLHAFNPARIGAQEHAHWFRARLDSPSCVLLIAQTPAGLPAGLVRFELVGSCWELSYSLDAMFRGWGLARPLLAGAIRRFGERTGGMRVVGFVKPDNIASLRVFRSLGFFEEAAVRGGVPCHAFSIETGQRPSEED